MNDKQAKAIHLKDWLACFGFEPHHEARGELWYRSPFREESRPSFKLTASGKGWFDHGSGQGGNVLDFAMKYRRLSTVSEALRWLDREWNGGRSLPLFGGTPPARAPQPPAAPQRAAGDERGPIAITKLQALEHAALLGYLRSRGIPPAIARPYVREIHYTRAGKPYFALAFANDSGGHELRNPYFKGTLGAKDLTCLDLREGAQDGSTAVFEGFFDFLTALTVNALPEASTRVLVLNSTTMKERALARLRERAGPIALYLDHDGPGRASTGYFRERLPDRQVRDQSGLYAGHDDFNAMIAARQARRR